MKGRYPLVTIISQEPLDLSTIPTAPDRSKNRTMGSETTPLVSATPYSAQKKQSLLPYMVILLIGFTLCWILTSLIWHKPGLSIEEALLLCIVPLLQALWALGIYILGQRHQYFCSEDFLRRFPILWLPLFPVLLQTGAFFSQWHVVSSLLEDSLSVVLWLQALRILAIGSLVKWKLGIFPTSFAWGTAFPDFLFGLSAVWCHDWLLAHPTFLLVWSAVGFLLIVPVGVGIVQCGMAPTQCYTSRVSLGLVFEYPMVLAPGVVVPLLLSWNLLLVRYAWEKVQSQR